MDEAMKKAFDNMDQHDIEVVYAVLDVLLEIMVEQKLMSLPFLYVSKLHKDAQGMLMQKIREKKSGSN